MSYIAQAVITIQVSGGKTLTLTLPNPTLTNPPQFSSSPAADTTVTLASASRTTIAVPSGALYALVIPPTTIAVAKTWDASGTVGGPLHAANPSLIGIPPATANIYITAASGEAVEILFI